MKTQFQKTQSGCRHVSNGFTLVELLVGIAIIATLAVLVSMMARNSMKKAKVSSAINAIRQVATANMEFSMENDSHIATLRWENDPEGQPTVRNSFWGRLTPYLFPDITTTNQPKLKTQINARLDSLFSTPDADTMSGTLLAGSRIYHDESGLPVPFAFNEKLNTWNDWGRVNKQIDAAQVMYITYGFGMFNEDDGQQADPRPTDGSRPTNSIYYLDNGKAMVAFLDGRVDLISAPISARRFEAVKTTRP